MSVTASAEGYRSHEGAYRRRWTWDTVAWGTHCVDCYPGNCPMRVYVRDGIVWREEQSGTVGTVEEGVPDARLTRALAREMEGDRPADLAASELWASVQPWPGPTWHARADAAPAPARSRASD